MLNEAFFKQTGGTHGLPLKGAVIDVPFSPDTTAVPIELLFYMEKTEAWEECVQFYF